LSPVIALFGYNSFRYCSE